MTMHHKKLANMIILSIKQFKRINNTSY